MRFIVGSLVLLVALFCTSQSEGQGKVNKKNVVVKTYDGVELAATYYPNPGGKREATVILLHDFDLTKGGSSQTQEWSNLAASLQAAGYVVISFDFRGFGDSKNVDPGTFWSRLDNKRMVKKGASGKAMLIDHKNFQSGYAPYLLNDIAAIKAYLDRQNDNKECNTASTILIGAGSGAALGSLWMGNESRRKRDKGNPLALVPTLGEPEVKDIAAAIWLSIAPRIGTSKGVGGKVASSLVEACVKNKVPVAFVFGSLDSASDTLSRNLEGRINGTGKTKGKDAALKVIKDTKLAGEKLLNRALPTE